MRHHKSVASLFELTMSTWFSSCMMLTSDCDRLPRHCVLARLRRTQQLNHVDIEHIMSLHSRLSKCFDDEPGLRFVMLIVCHSQHISRVLFFWIYVCASTSYYHKYRSRWYTYVVQLRSAVRFIKETFDVISYHTVQNSYRVVLLSIVKCDFPFVICCNFSESSGIDGPFASDWLTNSDGLAGCSESTKESLLRVDISSEFIYLLYYSTDFLWFSSNLHVFCTPCSTRVSSVSVMLL